MFQAGNKLATGGRRRGAGRPKGTAIAPKKQAEEIARACIEQNIQPIMAKYIQLAREGDPIILKHFIDRVIPPRAPEDKQGRSWPMVQINAYIPIDGSSK